MGGGGGGEWRRVCGQNAAKIMVWVMKGFNCVFGENNQWRSGCAEHEQIDESISGAMACLNVRASTMDVRSCGRLL